MIDGPDRFQIIQPMRTRHDMTRLPSPVVSKDHYSKIGAMLFSTYQRQLNSIVVNIPLPAGNPGALELTLMGTTFDGVFDEQSECGSRTYKCKIHVIDRSPAKRCRFQISWYHSVGWGKLKGVGLMSCLEVFRLGDVENGIGFDYGIGFRYW